MIQRNIETTGRIIRGFMAFVMLAAAVTGFILHWSLWIVIPLALMGLFTTFEAVGGWCVIRAAGYKTKF